MTGKAARLNRLKDMPVPDAKGCVGSGKVVERLIGMFVRFLGGSSLLIPRCASTPMRFLYLAWIQRSWAGAQQRRLQLLQRQQCFLHARQNQK